MNENLSLFDTDESGQVSIEESNHANKIDVVKMDFVEAEFTLLG